MIIDEAHFGTYVRVKYETPDGRVNSLRCRIERPTRIQRTVGYAVTLMVTEEPAGPLLLKADQVISCEPFVDSPESLRAEQVR